MWRPMPRTIKPQKGPQEAFLSTSADIAIFGSGAGTGKSFGLLMDPLRGVHLPDFRAVAFRRTTVDLRKAGGLLDKAREIYKGLGADIITSPNITVKWESGAEIQMGHLQHAADRFDHDGAEYAVILWDELQHFEESQFWHLWSRNRSACGIRPYMRATCNPDADSWLAKFLEWWIDQDTGFPIWERSGVLRYFTRPTDGRLVWGASAAEVREMVGAAPDDEATPVASVTFIPARLDDNQELLRKDPHYKQKLALLPMVERARLLGGNWKIRYTAGTYFRREWFPVVDALPAGCRRVVRYWDRGATPKAGNNDPSYTAGLRMWAASPTGPWYIDDMVRFRGRPAAVQAAIENTASQDGRACTVGIEQDPGQAGVFEADYYVKALAGYHVAVNRVDKNKGVRARPVSAQAERGNIVLVRGAWNEDFLTEVQGFDGSDKGHADQVDTLSGAFAIMTDPKFAPIAVSV